MFYPPQVYLIGGSIPEVSNGKYYNTSTVWCPQGQLLATHRKIHLFDIGNWWNISKYK